MNEKTADLKFCKDCKFYEINLCAAPAFDDQRDPDLVTGKPKYVFAALKRADAEECGRDAKYFEPKDPAPF
jgi:hypothetical protein